MSKKDEIMEIIEVIEKRKLYLEGDEYYVHERDFETAAKEIEALFSKSNAESFAKGQVSVRRRNKSGCCCIISDNEDITSVCGAHQNWHDELLEDGKVVKLEEILQYTSTGVWYDYSKSSEEVNQEIRTIRDNAIIRCKDTKYKFRIVFRTTRDKTIEEDK